jgi:EAL domain-containing protein (putative c-di-GMP-specific phosphodiesterase class I)
MALRRSIHTLVDLRTSLEGGEMRLVYLPILALSDGSCMGAEALIYWRRGNVVLRHSEFLNLVLSTPVSRPLAYWAIDTVAAELGAWLTEHPRFQISINVPRDIVDRGAPEYAAARCGLSGHVDKIVLEVTEHTVPDRSGVDALNALAERGVRISLDEAALCGVDLALFARCNFGIIKLDRSVTCQLTPNVEPAWLPKVGSLLRNSSIQVIADGVESLYQASALRRAGVQMAQGSLFSPPLPAAELKSYVTSLDHLEPAGAS